MRRVEEEVGNEQGEAEGEEGMEAALRAGSGVQEAGVHLQERVAVAVKIRRHCHHLLTSLGSKKENIHLVNYTHCFLLSCITSVWMYLDLHSSD